MDSAGKFVIFQTFILDKTTHRQAILLGVLNGMSKREGYCYASNKTLSEILKCSVDSLQRDLTFLESKQLIRRVITRNDKNEIVSRKIFVVDTMNPTAEMRIPSPQDCDYPSPQDCDSNNYSNTNNNNSIIERFEKLWDTYTKRGTKQTSLDRFKKLSKKTIEAIEEHLPLYVKNHIDNDKLQFLPYFEKYINLKKWQDELPYKSKQIETVSKSYSKLNLND